MIVLFVSQAKDGSLAERRIVATICTALTVYSVWGNPLFSIQLLIYPHNERVIEKVIGSMSPTMISVISSIKLDKRTSQLGRMNIQYMHKYNLLKKVNNKCISAPVKIRIIS